MYVNHKNDSVSYGRKASSTSPRYGCQLDSCKPTAVVWEVGIETDTNRMKIGNGILNWASLPYFPSDSGLGSVFDGGTPSSTYGSLPPIIDCGGVT